MGPDEKISSAILLFTLLFSNMKQALIKASAFQNTFEPKMERIHASKN